MTYQRKINIDDGRQERRHFTTPGHPKPLRNPGIHSTLYETFQLVLRSMLFVCFPPIRQNAISAGENNSKVPGRADRLPLTVKQER
jgi:hypothetical protein